MLTMSCAEYDRSRPLFERDKVPCEFVSCCSSSSSSSGIGTATGSNNNYIGSSSSSSSTSSMIKRVVPCTLRLLEGRRRCTQTQRDERVIRFEVSDECSSIAIQHGSSTNVDACSAGSSIAASFSSGGVSHQHHFGVSMQQPSDAVLFNDRTPFSSTDAQQQQLNDDSIGRRPMMQLQQQPFRQGNITSATSTTHTTPSSNQGNQQGKHVNSHNAVQIGNSSSSSSSAAYGYPKFCVMGPMRLFELEVGESDFVELRRDQALLVDFHNFAHSFVSLLRYCDLGDDNKGGNDSEIHYFGSDPHVSVPNNGITVRSPFGPNNNTNNLDASSMSRYTCRIEDFSSTSTASNRGGVTNCNTNNNNNMSCYNANNASSTNNNKIGARFMVVESNQFRELTHLSLNLQIGTDASIRSYLSTRLGQSTCENLSLRALLDSEIQRAHASEELYQQMASKFHSLAATSDAEIRNERLELTEQMQRAIQDEIKKYKQLLQEKEDTFHSLQDTLQNKLEKVQDTLNVEESCVRELRHEKKLLEARMEQLHTTLEIRDSSLKEITFEAASAKSKIRLVEKDNNILDKTLHQSQLRIEALEQSMEGKETILLQADVNREAAEKASVQASESLHMYKTQLEEARTQLALITTDMTNATGLSTQLQQEKRDTKSKLKLRAKVIRRQEEVLCEKDMQLSNCEQKLTKLLMEREKNKNTESTKGRELDATKKKLAESAKLLEKNKHVITFLNKELNARALSHDFVNTPHASTINESSAYSAGSYTSF